MMDDKFVVAAAAGEYVKVREGVRRSGVEVDWQDERGNTALIKAAQHGNGAICLELVNAKAKCEIADELGYAALHLACRHGHRHIVRLLGVTGADVHVKDSKGNTPSHLAAAEGQLSVLDELNSLGCDWTMKNNEGRNVLEEAQLKKQDEAVRFIATTMQGHHGSGRREYSDYAFQIKEELKQGSKDLPLPPLDQIEVLTRGNLEKDKEIEWLRQLNHEMMQQLEQQAAENRQLELNIEQQRLQRHQLSEEEERVWADITEKFKEKAQLGKQKAVMDEEKRELRRRYDDQRCQLTLLTDKVLLLRQDCSDIQKRLNASEQLLKNSELACSESKKRRKEVEAILFIPKEDVELTDTKLIRGSFGDACIGSWRDSLVAVKIFTNSWMEDKHNLEAFEEEAAFCGRTLHPHIAVTHGILTQEGIVIGLVTELSQGSLEDVIQAARGSGKYLTLQEQVDISLDSLSGLSFLHRPVRPYVHTDLSPRSILMSVLMRAKIGELSSSCFSRALSSTSTDRPQYAAPETEESRNFSRESDVYSMGVTLCELFTAKQAGYSSVELLVESVGNSKLQTVCHKMVCKNATERLPAADALKAVNFVALTTEYCECPPKRFVKGLLEDSKAVTLIDSTY